MNTRYLNLKILIHIKLQSHRGMDSISGKPFKKTYKRKRKYIIQIYTDLYQYDPTLKVRFLNSKICLQNLLLFLNN